MSLALGAHSSDFEYPPTVMNRRSVGLVVVLVAAVASAVFLGARAQSQESVMVEWPFVGADQAHTKFSTAAQVTLENVDQLEIAWEWNPANFRSRNTAPGPGASR